MSGETREVPADVVEQFEAEASLLVRAAREDATAGGGAIVAALRCAYRLGSLEHALGVLSKIVRES